MSDRSKPPMKESPSSAGGPASDSTPPGPGLVRGLGIFDTTMLTVGSVIGTGIFIVTADIARILPNRTWILGIWAVGGLFVLAGALTYAELGALYPRAGGLYHYLKEAYGTLWGFLFGWTSFLIIMSGGIAALAVAFGEYLGSFLPFFSTGNILLSSTLGSWTWTVSGGQVAGVLAILLLTAVNYLGLREGKAVQNLLTLIRIGSIVGFVILGLFASHRVSSVASSAVPAGGLITAFGIAMIAVLWTYDGWYGPTYSAGEMRNPGRTLPFGLIWGTVLIIVLYVAINLVYFRALSLEEMAATPRIAETAAAALFGPSGARVMSLAVLISTFGCLSATILYSSRIYLPMAQDGVFFRALAVVHPRFHVPGRSLWAQSLWAIALTLSGTYEQLYTYVVFAVVLSQIAGAAAVFVLRSKYPDAERPYRTWGYPWVPALFILASALLVINTLLERPVESLIGLGFIATGLPAYAWWQRSRPDTT